MTELKLIKQHDTHAALRIVVYGTPGPQGSKTFKGRSRTGKAIMIESSKKVQPWRERVHAAALTALAALPELRNVFPLDGPIAGRFVFTLRKPLSAPKRRRTWPITYPDTSKLLRSTEDALTTAGVWVDDARLVELDRLAKVYPGEDPEALDRPGALIVLRQVTEGPVAPDLDVRGYPSLTAGPCPDTRRCSGQLTAWRLAIRPALADDNHTPEETPYA